LLLFSSHCRPIPKKGGREGGREGGKVSEWQSWRTGDANESGPTRVGMPLPIPVILLFSSHCRPIPRKGGREGGREGGRKWRTMVWAEPQKRQ